MGNTFRNIAVIGSDGAGKTTLAAAIANIRKKEVKEAAPAMLDTEPEEKKRGFTIATRLASAKYEGSVINVLDTPGFSNFIHDADVALSVVEAAVLVMDASSETPHQTDEFADMAHKQGVPMAVFINKFDLPRSKFNEALERIERETGRRPLPMCMPVGVGEEFQGVIDLFSMKMLTPTGKAFGEVRVQDIPEEFKGEAEEYHLKLVEATVENDEDLMSKYLDGQSLTQEELAKGLNIGFAAGSIAPIFSGSAQKGVGVAPLLDFVNKVVTPGEAPKKLTMLNGKDQEVEVEMSLEGNSLARVFKVSIDHFTGRMAYARIYSGKFASSNALYNPNTRNSEKASAIVKFNVDKQEPIEFAEAGDIAVFLKLKETKTSHTLVAGNQDLRFLEIPRRKPMITLAISPKDKGEEEKMAQAVNRACEEDYGLTAERDPVSKELLISGRGQSHLEIAMEKMKRKAGVDLELKDPTVQYRETFRKSASGQGKYKKQSGGRGQYGDVHVRIDPLPRGSGFEFKDEIVGGAIPRNFLPAVEKGIIGALEHGPVGGFPVVDFAAAAFDGSYHEVDSSEMAFKVAGSFAFKKVTPLCDPVILEPIMKLSIKIPEEYTGDIMGDLNSRRGRVLGMERLDRGWQQINATVPMAEMLRYAPELQSMTQGNGSFECEFDRYEELPAHLKEKVVKEFGRKVQEEEE